MKQTLDWYRHESVASESPKLIALRASPYGWAGEGRYWALCGIIARSDGCRLDLGRKFARPGVASKLDFTVGELEDFLLCLRDDCELIEYDGQVASIERLRASLDEVMPERERKARARAASAERPRPVRAPSADECEKSADESEKSADAAHRAEAEADTDTEAEQSRDGGALLAFALELALEKGARSPAAMAKKLAREPDVVAAFRAQIRDGPRDDSDPEPPECSCGGEIKADRWGGEGRCLECGAWWRYERQAGEWRRETIDEEAF